MLQQVLNLTVMFVCYWFPAWLNIVYAVLGLYLTVMNSYFRSTRRRDYKFISLIISICCLFKVLIALEVHYGDPISLIHLENLILSAFGLDLKTPFPDNLSCIFPELIIIGVCLLSSIRRLSKLSRKTRKLLNRPLVLLLLWVCCCLNVDLFSIGYNGIAITWVIFKLTCSYINSMLVTSLLFSLLTLAQILANLVYSVCGFQYDLKFYGIYPWDHINGGILICSFILSSLMYKKEKLVKIPSLSNWNSSYSEDPSIPLIRTNQVNLVQKLIALTQYFCLKIGLFIWVEFNPGLVGLFIIVWFGVILIIKDINNVMYINKCILLPVITSAYTYSCIHFLIYQETYWVHFPMLMTIILLTYLSSHEKSFMNRELLFPENLYGRIVFGLVSRTYFVSLMVLFATGLAKINLLHAGLMILCFYYLSDTKRVLKKWSVVIVYLVFLLFIRESWNYAKQFIDYTEEQEHFIKLVGLNPDKLSQEFRTIDGVYWVMLLFCGIQQYSNNCIDKGPRPRSRIYKFLDEVYKYFIRCEIWLIYSVFILLAFFKEANFLNYFRCFLILVVISRHLGSPVTNSYKNFSKLGSYLNTLMTYCMIVLCIRYVYQFLAYFEEFPMFDKIGLEVYERLEDLYFTIGTDTFLVLFSILAKRCNTNWLIMNDDTANEMQKTAVNEKIMLNVYFVSIESLHYFIIVVISALAIFWKLSISMLVYLLFIMIFQFKVSIQAYINKCETLKELEKPEFLTGSWNDAIMNTVKEKMKSLRKELRDKERNYRIQLWRVSYTWTFICINLSYLRFFCLIDVGSWDSILDTIFFVSGYSASHSIIFVEASGYFIIFVLLIVEGNFFSEISPNDSDVNIESAGIELKSLRKNDSSIGKTALQNPMAKLFPDSSIKKKLEIFINPVEFFVCFQRYQSTLRKINKHEFRSYLKILFEVAIVSTMIYLSVYKLTVFSVLNVILLIFGLLINSNIKFILLSLLMYLSFMLQYILCLTNLSEDVSPEYFSKSIANNLQQISIPWAHFSEIQTFSGFSLLGVTHKQFDIIFYESLICTCLLIYWKYIQDSVEKLIYLNKVLPDIKNNKFCSTFAQQQNNYKNVESLSIIASIVNFIYKFGRIIVVIVVLLFAVQSKGIPSVIYCTFCIFLLYNENLIGLNARDRNEKNEERQESDADSEYGSQDDDDQDLPIDKKNNRNEERNLNINDYNKSENIKQNNTQVLDINDVLKRFDWYIRIIYYFLLFISIDLFVEILITMLIYYQTEESRGKWLDVFQFWNVEGQEISLNSTFEETKLDLWLKTSSFCMLLFIRVIMESKHFLENQKKVCENISKQSESIFYHLTYSFHKRVQKADKKLTNIKKSFEVAMDKLFILNNSYNESVNSSITKSSILESQILSRVYTQGINTVNQEIIFTKEKEEKTVYLIADFLLKHTNPYLFNRFMRKLVLPGSTLSDKKRFESSQALFNLQKNSFFGDKTKNIENFSSSQPVRKESDTQDTRSKIFGLNTEYEVSWRNYPELICYFLTSNTEFIVYIAFLINHIQNGSFESLVFPITVFGYAMLEYPRPRMKFFRSMMIYTFFVLSVKYIFQLNIMKKFAWVREYKDPYRIGFKVVKDEEFFQYVLWDVIVLLTILCREYYMIRIGMWNKSEVDSGMLSEAANYLKEKKGEQLVKPDSFFERLIPKDSSFKPGIDLYLCTFLMQLLIFVYLILFFGKIDGFNEDISNSIKASKFQGRMIIALLAVLFLIIFDRYVYIQHCSITLDERMEIKDENLGRTITQKKIYRKLSLIEERKSKKRVSVQFYDTTKFKLTTSMKKYENNILRLLIIKLVFHWLILVIVHFIIFWYFPYENGENPQDNDYQKLLYVMFLLYLTFQSQQFRFGLPSFIETSSPLMRHIKSWSSSLFKFYRALPFLYELKTVIDWTFTKTALNLYQWIKFEEIQIQLFFNDCTQKSLKYKKHGDKIGKLEKCQYGICSFCLMLIIIFLPLIIFSTLNPFSIPNQIISASLNVKAVIDDRAFKLYSVNSADNLIPVDKDLYDSEGFNVSVELNKDDFNMMQQIRMPNGPDYNWDITPIAEQKMKSLLEKVLDSEQIVFKIEYELAIKRNYPKKHQSVTLISDKNMTMTHADKLYKILFDSSNETLILENMTYSVFRLPSAGSFIEAYPYTKDSFFNNIELALIRYENGRYWQATSKKEENIEIGPTFYVISDDYYPGTFDYSVITFYISIVYLAGKVLRLMLVGYGLNIIVTDMKNCEHLRTLCSAVFINRMSGKFYEEERLYFELIDILRSPELTKVLTKSSRIKKKND